LIIAFFDYLQKPLKPVKYLIWFFSKEATMILNIFGTGICVHNLPEIKTDRSPPGFLLTWHENNSQKHLLIEYPGGSTYRLGQRFMSIGDIRKVFISHVHPDHFCAAELIQALSATPDWDPRFKGQNFKLDVFCHPSVEAAFRQLVKLQLPQLDGNFPGNIEVAFHTEQENRIGKAELTMLPVFHSQGKTDCNGSRLEMPGGEVFVYSGDTARCPTLVELAKDADLFLCEISARIDDFNSAAKYGHMTPRQAGEMAKEAGVRHLVLFHFSGQDPNEAIYDDCRRSGFGGNITIPYDGDIVAQN